MALVFEDWCGTGAEPSASVVGGRTKCELLFPNTESSIADARAPLAISTAIFSWLLYLLRRSLWQPTSLC